MVARRRKRVRQLPENSLAVVLDLARLAVKKLRGADDSPSERRPDRLMPQANSKNRKLRGEALDEFHGNACLLRRARARRNHDLLRPAAGNLFHGDLVVAVHLHLASQFAQILRQVVGKRVVVVEQQDHRDFPRGAMPCAVSHAAISAHALFTHSWYSAAGEETATIPPPACTYATLFLITMVRRAMQESRFPAKSR